MLDDIIEHGTTVPPTNNWITCKDGFRMSVIASWACYCSPRPDWPVDWGGAGEGVDYTGPFTHVEVGLPSEQPEPWDQWSGYWEHSEHELDPTSGVYAYVPVQMVRDLVELHGGEE